MTIPIVVAAFGTTSRAMQTYAHMDAVFKYGKNSLTI